MRLFVGCADGVHSFDLARGERKHFVISGKYSYVTGLALDDSGAGTRLFALTSPGGVSRIDLHSGAITELIPNSGFAQLYRSAERVAWDASGFLIGAVYDAGTRSLIICARAHRLLRVRRL